MDGLIGLLFLAGVVGIFWFILDERPLGCKFGFNHDWENLTKDLGFMWFDVYKCKCCGKTDSPRNPMP